MEEKNTKKVTPMKKDEAKKKVEALKKQSVAAKHEREIKAQQPVKIDEKVLNREKSDITWSGITKDFRGNVKGNVKGFGAKVKGLWESFTKLGINIQICIIVPLAIILVLILNNVYTNSEKKTLSCTYTSYTSSMQIDQKVDFVFKKGKIYSQTVTTTYEIKDPKIKTLGQLETEKRDENEELNLNKGVSAKYDIKDDKLTNKIVYNYYKMSLDYMKERGFDKDGSLQTYAERFDTFGYTCEGDI